MGLSSPSHLVPTSLCDLGGVASEPPVLGHDHEDVVLGVSARETPASARRAQRAQGIISDGQIRGLLLGMGTSEAGPAALVP